MRKPLDVLYNFHWVIPGEAARSSQAYVRRLGAFLEAHSLRGLINLRGRHPRFRWWRYETAVCKRHGVSYFDAMLDSRNLPLAGMLVALFDAFDAVPRPFLIKCAGGQDRSSLVSALYVVHRKGWSALEEAQRQFARIPYLHFPKQEQRWLQLFLPYARAQAGDKPLAEWARTDYDPAAFATWLQASGMEKYFRGIFKPYAPPPAKSR
jgi:protein tyrosine/serine phosphatase